MKLVLKYVLITVGFLLHSCLSVHSLNLRIGTYYHPHDDNNHCLYIIKSGEPKEIQIKGNSRSILFYKDCNNNFAIAPFKPELLFILNDSL
jgi:hypothetical protein